MAKSLGLDVIAEGVETARQEAVIKRLGCHEVQGYLYGRAVQSDEFLAKWVLGDRALRGDLAARAIV